MQSVGFFTAVKLFFTRYADFRGRSRRSEYWWAYLFNTVVSLILILFLAPLALVWFLGTLVPNIAICIRRLHDIGKSGWYYLLFCIPLAGPIIMIVMCCMDSTADNQWGPNPKA